MSGEPRPAGLDRVPPQAFFGVSAVFHYLGPSLAVLLFARVPVLGVAWLRIASAAVVFALWRRPWRVFAAATARERMLLVVLGHRVANTSTGDGGPLDGIDRLGAAMLVAIVVSTPIGLSSAWAAFRHPWWLVLGVGVGVCS